ncbi:MAG: hypothetical protein A4E19_14410 [Nitrospira sp. SG-bin1]|nr:MAG: hypothetical protein A4E19_14410 [Nitrospira sp. SG-bin1]
MGRDRQNALILIVDDAEPVRYARRRILSQVGYQIIEASTGEEALILAVSHQPDLIVLDVSLPGIDGVEVCRRLKADYETIPIMVMQVSAARTSKLDLAAGLDGGADGYLIEPIDPLELLATVKALLRLLDREKRLRRTEQQFAEATSAADCGLWDWDIANGTLQWFGAHERLAGMVPGGFSGKIDAFSEILHPDDRPRVWNNVQSLMAARKESYSDDYRFVHPDGSVHWMTAKGRFFYDEAGHAVRMTGVVQDITPRKQAEDKLAQYRMIMTAATDGIAIIDPNAKYVEQNLAHRTILGYADEDLIGKTPAIHVGEEVFQRIVRELIDTRRFQGDVRSRRKDGQWVDIALSAFGIYDDKGEVLCYVGMKRDITERKRHEAALKESEERFRVLADQSPEPIWVTNLEGLEFVNAAYCRFFGVTTEEVRGPKWELLVHPEDSDRYIGDYLKAIREQAPFRSQARVRTADGTWRWIDSRGAPRFSATGDFLGHVGSSPDITAIKEAEVAVRESEARFRSLVETVGDVFWISDPESRKLMYASPAFIEIWGRDLGALYEQFAVWIDAIHPDDQERVRTHFFRDIYAGTYDEEYRIIRPDGTVRWVRDRGKPLGIGKLVAGVAEDFTERKQAEETVQQRTRQLDLLARTSRHLILSEDPQELLENIFVEIAELIDMEMFYHYRLDNESPLLRLRTSGGITEQERNLFATMRFGELMCGRVAESRQLLLVEDLQHSHHPGCEILHAAGATSYAGFPLLARGQLLGTVAFVSRRRVRFRDGDMQMVQAICDLIATTLDRARLMNDLRASNETLRDSEEQLRRWKDELEIRVRERTSELLMTQERLMAVTSQLSLTEQRERRKLARDLHDYLAQMLVVGEMKTKMLKKQGPPSPAGVTLVDDLDQVFQQALNYTRTLIAELSPPSLQDSGLPAALTWLGERFQKDGLRVDVKADCASVPLPEEEAVVVFQAVRELLFNVLKHAGVDQATVVVTLDDEQLRVAVEDKGKGLKPDASQRSVEPGHLGLVSVKERFRAMDGRVEVVSELGRGTTVTLVLPLRKTGIGKALRGEGSSDASRVMPRVLPVRVLLVDDHNLVRQGVRDLLAADDRIRVVGEARTGEEALILAANLAPDVILTDINLPDISGIETTKRFKRLHPQVAVIGFSVHADELTRNEMIAVGAETLLTKGCLPEELTAAIVACNSQRLRA